VLTATRSRPEGPYRGLTLDAVLRAAVDTGGDRVALVDGATTLSWAVLDAVVDGVAARLSAVGVGPGDVVMVQLPNWWETVAVFYAVARLGAVVNPVVPIYREAEIAFILREAQPAAVVVPGRFRGFDHAAMLADLTADTTLPRRPAVLVARPDEELPAGLEPLPSGPEWLQPGPHDPPSDAIPSISSCDVALLLYTSGTTANPKGVLHSSDTLIYECESIGEVFGLGPSDLVFMASPLAHITGLLYGIILPALLGSGCVLMDVWEPDRAVDLIEAHACRFTIAATPFLHGVTEVYAQRGVPCSLAAFGCGGADVPPELVRRASTVLDAVVTRMYGSSECPTYTCGRPGDPLELRATTDGPPVGPHAHGRLDDVVDGVGELLVTAPELFLGYLDPSLNEAAFTADGYFRTGDLATIDERSGCVTIVGRAKDIIIRKGEKISARQVEDMLYQHPDVADVAVVAVPDPAVGERACAVVVPAAGRQPTLGELTRFLDGFRVARQKHPEELELVEELPRTASGKVQKYLLRQRLAERVL
jgi:cyclohexanecarboxylate-CoA ligase